LSLTAEDRRLRAQIGAHTKHALYGTADATTAARAGFFAKFFDQTDPSLPTEERLRRAHHLMAAHMKRLALKSAQARRRKVAG
jgi:hypothetical protein